MASTDGTGCTEGGVEHTKVGSVRMLSQNGAVGGRLFHNNLLEMRSYLQVK